MEGIDTEDWKIKILPVMLQTNVGKSSGERHDGAQRKQRREWRGFGRRRGWKKWKRLEDGQQEPWSYVVNQWQNNWEIEPNLPHNL